MGDAIDGHRALTANPFAAVVVEGNGIVALGDEVLVEEVHHFEEGRGGGNVVHLVIDELALAGTVLLAPDFEFNGNGVFGHGRNAFPSLVYL